MTFSVEELREALDIFSIELPDMPGQLLVNEEAYHIIHLAARLWLELETDPS